jgi:[acyl-carrier-protein] S-malonyltransferase
MTGPVFVFPGQGAQKVGMGKQLAEAYPESVGAVYATADAVLGFSVSKLCFEGPNEALGQTENTQPALFATSVATLSAVRAAGIEARAAAGHSVGEYAALVAAGAITFEDALPVVRLRGELMAAAVAGNPGAMAAIIGLPASEVKAICNLASEHGTVEPANINGPTQVVISGETAAVMAAMELAKERGGRAIRLNVSAPFHCSLMEPVRSEMEPALAALPITDPAIPVVANATGRYVTTANEVRSALLDQLASPVRWTDSVALLVREGLNSCIEIGPGRVLSGLIRSIDPDVRTTTVSTPRDIEQLIAQEI